MKRILTVIMIAAACGTLQAQDASRIGLKGAFNSTWLLNKNVSDKNDQVDYASSFGASFGAQYVHMLSDKYGISAELLFSSHVQKYDGTFSDQGITFTTTTEDKLSYLDIPILFRAGSGTGVYFEIGPQLSFLMGAKESWGTSPGSPVNYSDKDFKDDFSGFGLAGVLGFGVDIEVSDALVLSPGLRFGYGLTDATTEYSKTEFNKLEDGEKLSVNAQINHTTGADVSQGVNQEQFGYEKTSRVFGGLHISLTYKLQ